MGERESSVYVVRYLLCFLVCFTGSQAKFKVEATTLADASEEQNALQQALLLVELLKLEYARVLRENNEMLKTNEIEQTNGLTQDDLVTCGTTNMNPKESSPNSGKKETETTYLATPQPSQWSRSRRAQQIFPGRRWQQYAPHNGYNLYYDIPARRYLNNDYNNEENARGWRKFSYEDPFGPQPGNANLAKTSAKSTNSPTYTTSIRATSKSETLTTKKLDISTTANEILTTTTLDSAKLASETSSTKFNSESSATSPSKNSTSGTPASKSSANTNVNSMPSTSAASATAANNHVWIKSSSSSSLIDTQKTASNKIMISRPTRFTITTAVTSTITTSPTVAHFTKSQFMTNHDESSPSQKITMKKLSHKITIQVPNEPELSQAAAELENELNANFGKTFTTRNSLSRKIHFSWPGTTKIYLARSSRYPIPLPENNAFCHSNPDSALCRTFI